MPISHHDQIFLCECAKFLDRYPHSASFVDIWKGLPIDVDTCDALASVVLWKNNGDLLVDLLLSSKLHDGGGLPSWCINFGDTVKDRHNIFNVETACQCLTHKC